MRLLPIASFSLLMAMGVAAQAESRAERQRDFVEWKQSQPPGSSTTMESYQEARIREINAWKETAATVEGMQGYLDRYPNGKFSPSARDALDFWLKEKKQFRESEAGKALLDKMRSCHDEKIELRETFKRLEDERQQLSVSARNLGYEKGSVEQTMSRAIQLDAASASKGSTFFQNEARQAVWRYKENLKYFQKDSYEYKSNGARYEKKVDRFKDRCAYSATQFELKAVCADSNENFCRQYQ